MFVCWSFLLSVHLFVCDFNEILYLAWDMRILSDWLVFDTNRPTVSCSLFMSLFGFQLNFAKYVKINNFYWRHLWWILGFWKIFILVHGSENIFKSKITRSHLKKYISKQTVYSNRSRKLFSIQCAVRSSRFMYGSCNVWKYNYKFYTFNILHLFYYLCIK